MPLAASQASDSRVNLRHTDTLADGEVWYTGPVCYEPDGLTLAMVWDVSIPGPRCYTEAERKTRAAEIKTEEISVEMELRTRTVWGGNGVDRHLFAWIEEFYTSILKVAARNNITEADSPITWGLKQLRDNRDTLLAGLQTWVDDPTKTADDILAFDVAGWSGWTIARPL